MTIKFAIAGAGYIARIHARAILSQENTELVAVVGKFSDNAAAFSRMFNLKKQYGTIKDLLQGDHVDALVICTPNYLHVSQAVEALNAGVAVLVEKPMAMNAREAQQMVDAGTRSGAALMVAHNWRFDQDVLWLQKESTQLGQIIRTKGNAVHVNWGPSGWFTQKILSGGGALVDMGVHAIDTVRFLLGDPQPISVYARLGTYYKEFDVDDTGILLVNWENGTVSYIEFGWWQPHADGPSACTQLYGEKGFGQVFPTKIQFEERTVDPGFAYPRPEHQPQSMYNSQMAYFLQCIRTGQRPSPGGVEGLVNMKIVDAGYESARSGKLVRI